MMQIRFTNNEFIYYGAVAGGILGLLLGLGLLILGFVKKKRSYGVFGFLGALVVGPISGVLSIIVAAIFTYLILRKPNTINDSTITSNSQMSDSDVSGSTTSNSEAS